MVIQVPLPYLTSIWVSLPKSQEKDLTLAVESGSVPGYPRAVPEADVLTRYSELSGGGAGPPGLLPTQQEMWTG